MAEFENLADRAETARLPIRDDEVAAWIKRRRDECSGPGFEDWEALNGLLDEYRLHADTGTPLSEVAHEGGYGAPDL